MAKDELINKFKYIGTRPNRPDGLDKVTGRAKYGADFNAPNMLHAAVLRSPHAHARITKIDTSKACLLYTSPSPRDVEESRMPSSA